MPARTRHGPMLHGTVRPGFEAVRAAFADNLEHRHELGAACCVYRNGEKVVDLWGGVRDKATGKPWQEDTMVVVFSATKGLAAMTLALAHSRGWLDYDERVCSYWPEFAQNGKERITVRQLLAHQAGLFGFDELVDRTIVADLDQLAAVLARQRPAWEPGTRQAYHAISLGFYEGELLRRVDPQCRTLGRFFAEDIATPLGIDVYVRLPESIADERLAPLDLSPFRTMRHLPLSLILAAFYPRSILHRSVVANPGTLLALDQERIYARDLEVPSGGGVGTARGIARAYSVFATDGADLGVGPATLAELAAPPVPPRSGYHDDCMRGDLRFSLGFMRPGPVWRFGSPSAYGAPGAGGALGYADPETGIAYAYVCNYMDRSVDDPRDVALRTALDACVRESSGSGRSLP